MSDIDTLMMNIRLTIAYGHYIFCKKFMFDCLLDQFAMHVWQIITRKKLGQHTFEKCVSENEDKWGGGLSGILSLTSLIALFSIIPDFDGIKQSLKRNAWWQGSTCLHIGSVGFD